MLDLSKHKPDFFDRSFVENINFYFKNDHVTQQSITQKLQVSNSVFRSMMHGNTKPSSTQNMTANTAMWPIVEQLFINAVQ